MKKRLTLPTYKFEMDDEYTIKKVTKLNKVVYYLKNEDDFALITVKYVFTFRIVK